MTPALRWTALVVALLAYPFVDRALGTQTGTHSDGRPAFCRAGLNIVVGHAGLLDRGTPRSSRSALRDGP
jgi:hypothetical protein